MADRNALYWDGRQVRAAELHDRLVEAFRSALGPDHLETITALAYQATILRDAGQYARWADQLLQDQVAFAPPSAWEGRSAITSPACSPPKQ